MICGVSLLSVSLPFVVIYNRKKKETEAKVRITKSSLKDINMTETVEGNVRNDQHGREKNEKALRTETKTNLRDVNISETVETNVRAEQFGREKDEKSLRTKTKVELADVVITETVETNVRAEQFGREKDDKNLRTETKTNLRDVVITDTVEGDVRKEHHGREKDWKQTGRQQKQENTSFDMVRYTCRTLCRIGMKIKVNVEVCKRMPLTLATTRRADRASISLLSFVVLFTMMSKARALFT
jgi:hypothetical protein